MKLELDLIKINNDKESAFLDKLEKVFKYDLVRFGDVIPLYFWRQIFDYNAAVDAIKSTIEDGVDNISIADK